MVKSMVRSSPRNVYMNRELCVGERDTLQILHGFSMYQHQRYLSVIKNDQLELYLQDCAIIKLLSVEYVSLPGDRMYILQQ